MILAVTLNSTIDIVIPVNNLKPGSVSRTKAIYTYPGGKATNVARALKQLGATAHAIGFVGIRDSRETEHFLKHHGVTSSYIPCTGSNRICLLLTETKDVPRETVINSESDIDITKKEIDIFLQQLKTLSIKASHIIFSGSLPLSLPSNFYETALKVVDKNCISILDTSAKYLFHGIKASPKIIKQNLSELESAFHVKLTNPSKIKKFVSALSIKYKVPIIIVTMDKKGSLVFDNGSFYFYPAIKVKKIISPVGSGDAFSAGLVYGLSKGYSVKNSCKWAASAASANLSHLGSCFISRKNVLKYLANAKITNY
ncbi:MAG: PfkB family carbohydrate kinase [bacterium]